MEFRGELKQNTTPEIYFNLVDSTTGADKTGISAITVYYSKNGGSVINLAGPVMGEISAANMPGVYKLSLTAAMTDTLGELMIYITTAGTNSVKLVYKVVANITSDIKAVVDEVKVKTDNLTFTGTNVNAYPVANVTVADLTQAAKDALANQVWAVSGAKVPFRSEQG